MGEQSPPPILSHIVPSIDMGESTSHIVCIVIFVRESSTTESLEEAKASVAGIQALDSPLVSPVITPRCSNRAIEK